VNRTAVFKIANKRDGQPIYSSQLLTDSEQIEERLSRMFETSVSYLVVSTIQTTVLTRKIEYLRAGF